MTIHKLLLQRLKNANANTYLGRAGEITIDTSVGGNQLLKIHDGTTPGGENLTVAATVTAASANQLGGVKVGAGLAIAQDGTLSATGGTGSTNTLVSGTQTATLTTMGTLSMPSLLPKTFTAVMDDVHMINAIGFVDNNWWSFVVEFQVTANGAVATYITNNTPWPSNPGYVSGHAFRFVEADHGIPGYTIDISLVNIQNAGGAGYTTNLAVTQPPSLPSTITAPDAIKLTADAASLVFGANGTLSVVDVQASGSQTRYLNNNGLGLSIDGGNVPNSIDIGDLSSADFIRLKWGTGSVTGNTGDIEFWAVPIGGESVPSSISFSPQGGYNGSFTFGGAGNLSLPSTSSILADQTVTLKAGNGLQSAETIFIERRDELRTIFDSVQSEPGFPWGVSQPADTSAYDVLIQLNTGTFSAQDVATVKANQLVQASDAWQALLNNSRLKLAVGSKEWYMDPAGWLSGPSGSGIDFYDNQGVYNGQVGGDNGAHITFGSGVDKGIKLSTNSGTKTWELDTAGTLHLPAGGDIVNSGGVSVLGGAGFDQQLNSTSNVTFAQVTAPNVIQNTAWSTSPVGITVPGATPTVVHSIPNWRTGAKLVIVVEGQLDGDVNGVDHTQTCEATIAATFNTAAEPIMSVYGIVYTSPTPLATFTVARNTLAGTIEVTAVNSQTTNNLNVRVHAIEFVSRYD